MGGGGDAINEDNLVVCCSLCCANIALYPTCDAVGCSGKVGLCCLNCEVCCKVSLLGESYLDCVIYFLYRRRGVSELTVSLLPSLVFPMHPTTHTHKMGADCLPCCCCGPAIECDGCSVCNAQLHCCCAAVSAAFPCNDEVPCVVNVAGWTLYPQCKCFAPMREIMGR
jgi:hypothetical protein